MIYFVLMFLGHLLLAKPQGWVETHEKSSESVVSIFKNKTFLGIWLMFYINITCGLALIGSHLVAGESGDSPGGEAESVDPADGLHAKVVGEQRGHIAESADLPGASRQGKSKRLISVVRMREKSLSVSIQEILDACIAADQAAKLVKMGET